MGDISTWSPVDESNTMAPPNGWPESQPTNTVNNCARAMMGAVRRWYDTVTAQLASLTSSLANYLPLAGGVLSGPVSAPSYQLGGVAFANRDAVNNSHAIYDADGADPALILGGAATAYHSLYRAETHLLQSNSGAVTFAAFNAAGINVGGSGSVSVAQGITAGGNITGNVLTGNAVNSNGNIGAAGTITGNQVNCNGHIFTAGNINCNGVIDCAGNIDAGSYTLNGGPVVLLTEAQLDRIEERLARLERATA